MLEKLKNKLRSQAGESIAEVLVSLLIAALSLMLLAGMISATFDMVTRSRETVKTYVQANNTLVEQSGTGAAGSVSFTAGGSALTLTEGSTGSVNVSCFTNDTVGGKTVTSYKKGS